MALKLFLVVEAEDDRVDVEIVRLLQVVGRVAGSPYRKTGIDSLGLGDDPAKFVRGMATLAGLLRLFVEVVQVQADDLLVGER